MATYFPTDDSAWSLGHSFSSLSTFVRGGAMHLDALADGPRNLFHNASHGFQNLVSSLRDTHARPVYSAPQVSVALSSLSGTVQTVTDTAHTSTSTTPVPTSTTQTSMSTTPSNTPTLGAGAPAPASQIATGGENGLFKAIRACRRLMGMWITFFVVGVLSLALIVVPGLALGLVTGQLVWGITLSGAIVAVCAFYGGPVYTIISAGDTTEPHNQVTGDNIV